MLTTTALDDMKLCAGQTQLRLANLPESHPAHLFTVADPP